MKYLARSLGVSLMTMALATADSCPPTPSANYQTGNRLVFPIVAMGPTMDGVADIDPGWTGGFLFEMEHGGSFGAAHFRGVADANAIYIYVDVEDDGFDASDVVVIGLNPDNAGNNYHRVHVFPCPISGGCVADQNGQLAHISYATSNMSSPYNWVKPIGGDADGSVNVGGGTITARSATQTCAGVPCKWSVEVSIPRAAPFNFSTNNFFGLFVDVVRTNPSAGFAGEALQYTWPPDHFIGASENDVLSDLDTGTLGPGNWGNATLFSGFGNGVSITSSDITSNQTNPSEISLNSGNIFYGTAANYSSSGGTLVTAKAVNATFKIANFGLPAYGSFSNVPVAGNPTAAGDIAPAATATYATGQWNLTPQQKADYAANPHQCIEVVLASTDNTTVFVNPSAWRNMDFVTTSSPFHELAQIGTKGIEFRGDTLPFILREKFVNFDPRLTWKTEIRNTVRISDRVYRADVRNGNDHQLDITVDPPQVHLPSESLYVSPGTGGRERPPLTLDVRPNEVITFIASGSIEFDGQEVTAAGAPRQENPAAQSSKRAGPRRFGALLGSFDGFKETSFLIGSAATFKVPQNAARLQLKIDDDSAHYGKQAGHGYDVQIVRTAIEPWMVTNNPELRRAVRGSDVLVTLGANLPTWLLRGERDTGRYLRIGKSLFHVYQSAGTFGYMVRRTH